MPALLSRLAPDCTGGNRAHAVATAIFQASAGAVTLESARMVRLRIGDDTRPRSFRQPHRGSGNAILPNARPGSRRRRLSRSHVAAMPEVQAGALEVRGVADPRARPDQHQTDLAGGRRLRAAPQRLPREVRLGRDSGSCSRRAYLGGDLVYSQRIGITYADVQPPDGFTRVATSIDLAENTMKRGCAATPTSSACVSTARLRAGPLVRPPGRPLC